MGTTSILSKLTLDSDASQKDVLKLINSVVDEMSFVENDKLIRTETILGNAVGEGVLSGFASISDVRVNVFATNPAVLKGSIGKKNAAKIVRAVENALLTHSPIIGILDTQGARFSEGIEALEGYASIIKAFSTAYCHIPTILVIKGSNYGMLSYLSGMCDLCVAFDKSQMATSSPLIIASKTKVDAIKVGTAAVHASKTGSVTQIVKNEKELKTVISSFINYIVSPSMENGDDANRVCKGLTEKSKVNEIIAEAFDKNSFFEVKSEYAKEVITGFARLNGDSVGVVAFNKEVNEGRLSSKSAKKINEFLITCDTFSIPVVNLVDCMGAVSSLVEEEGGLIPEVANLMFTINSIEIPKISLVIGNAIGVGYVLFASKNNCNYTIAYEKATISPIDNMAAASLIYAADIASAKDKDKATEKLAESYREENTSAVAIAANGFIDNVIDINLTRQYLIMAIQNFAG